MGRDKADGTDPSAREKGEPEEADEYVAGDVQGGGVVREIDDKVGRMGGGGDGEERAASEELGTHPLLSRRALLPLRTEVEESAESKERGKPCNASVTSGPTSAVLTFDFSSV